MLKTWAGYIRTKQEKPCCLVTKSCPALLQSMDYSLPGSLSMGFHRQEYWSGLPFPSPGDLSSPGIKSISPALAGSFFTTELIREVQEKCHLSPKNIYLKNRERQAMPRYLNSVINTNLTKIFLSYLWKANWLDTCDSL